MKYCIPSHGRAKSIMNDTIALIPKEQYKNTYIFVNPVSQFEEYKKNCHTDINLIPVDSDGNVAVVRQAILDFFPDETLICMMDDDIQHFMYVTGTKGNGIASVGKIKSILPVADYIEKFMKSKNARICGMLQTKNNMFLRRTYSDFGTSACCVFIKTGRGLKYDVSYRLNEDTYLCALSYRLFGHSYIINSMSCICKTLTNKGGCVDYRNIELEREYVEKIANEFPEIFSIKELKTKKYQGLKNVTLKKIRKANHFPLI